MLRILLALVLLSTPAVAAQLLQPGDVAVQTLDNGTRYTLINETGYAGFTVPGTWQEKTVENTPPSSWVQFHVDGPDLPCAVGILLMTAGSEAETKAEAVDAKLHAQMTENRYKDWSIYIGPDPTPGIMQGIDAIKPVGGIVMRIRILFTAAPDASGKAVARLDGFLDTVDGGNGPYTLHPNEVVRKKPVR